MTIPNFPQEHINKILEHINVEAIRAKKFKVAVDMINASACVMYPYLFILLFYFLFFRNITYHCGKEVIMPFAFP